MNRNAPAGARADVTPLPIGVRTATYRAFEIPDLCVEVAGTPVAAVEVHPGHLPPTADDERIDDTRGAIDDAGLTVCGYGTVAFDDAADRAVIRRTLSTVVRLGGEYCVVAVPPDEGPLYRRLVAVADEVGVDLALHGGGPGSTRRSASDVTAALNTADDPHLGACVDTADRLRAGDPPAAVVSALGDRVAAVHLGDLTGTGSETVPGRGRLALPELLALLDEVGFARPLVIDYEGEPTNPTPAVREAAAAVVRARAGPESG